MKLLLLFLVVMISALGLSCEIEPPGCASDSECASPRICVDSVCTGVPVVGVNNANNTNNTNNANNQNNANNTNNVCDQVCELIDPDFRCIRGGCDFCQRNDECEVDEACEGTEFRSSCQPIDSCVVVGAAQGEPGELERIWQCDERGEASVACFPISDDQAECTCFHGDGLFTIFNADIDRVQDDSEVESLVNFNCRLRIRYTFDQP